MRLNVTIINIVKDHTKVLGFGTNRVVGKQLDKGGLSVGQMKSMSALQSLCGVKKTDTDKSVIEKITNKKIESKSKLLSAMDEEEKKNASPERTIPTESKKEVVNNSDSNVDNSKRRFSLRTLL
jgi:hypothetical protein